MTMIMMTENLETKFTINNLQIPICRHYEIREDSQKYGQRPGQNCEKVHFWQNETYQFTGQVKNSETLEISEISEFFFRDF